MNTGAYYDNLQKIYDLFYSKRTLGLHYGFWEKNTKTTEESIINTNKFVIKYLDINDNDTILDAGCGIGGTSIFIAKQSKGNRYYPIKETIDKSQGKSR